MIINIDLICTEHTKMLQSHNINIICITHKMHSYPKMNKIQAIDYKIRILNQTAVWHIIKNRC